MSSNPTTPPTPATETEKWIARYEACSWNIFGRRRLALSHGKGTRVWDIEGNEYLDFLTGIAVNALGHSHPAIVQAVRDQAECLIHCTNLYYIPAQIEWAEYLQKYSFGGRVCFSNSGAEANEAVLKMARRYAATHFTPERRTIITCRNSFHGRTLATLTATGQDKMHVGFDPLAVGFQYVDFNDSAGIRAMVEADPGKICAILVEPIQGEGGIHPATQEFMDTLAALRDEHGLLLLFDEVQCGLGRSGRNFAYQHYGVTPDAMTLAKPIAGGLAAGAIIASDALVDVMTPGSHGGTMIGNPLASAAGLAFCKVLFDEKLAERAAEKGERILSEFRAWADDGVPGVTGCRGMGLMLGLVLDRPAGPIVERCEKRGLLVIATAGNVIRLLPPLNVLDEEIDTALAIIRGELEKEA